LAGLGLPFCFRESCGFPVLLFACDVACDAGISLILLKLIQLSRFEKAVRS